ncbi:MAG TPA: YbhB/YbcL family Raf kinase inhibitor-like protein [Puia sp.]|nr:YbhB/YbcL family Raf kinase inhibitor-like protein [Puia sp.]
MISLASLMAWALQTSLSITSPAFTNNGNIPSKYSCEGDNTSPALHIDALPGGTKSLAIIVHDPDAPMAGGFTHWVAFNIDPTADIAENFKGGTQASNGAKKIGYIGPCPPQGTHHYHFMIYALDTKLSLDKNAGKAELEKAMEGHILSKGELIGLYKKTK